MPGDFMFKEKPFENSVGHFWGIMDTRDYMRARYAHVEALLKVKNRTAVRAALDHLLDMMRLNRSDNLGVRGLVPALYLRLGEDQACYDFLKWWYTRGCDGGYDFGNTDLPYLDIKDADIFESPDWEMGFSNLSHFSRCFFSSSSEFISTSKPSTTRVMPLVAKASSSSWTTFIRIWSAQRLKRMRR